MIYLADTSLLLNDFFHRHPQLAQVRGGREPNTQLLEMWQQSHEALLYLSLQPATWVAVAEYSILRLASVLSDLRIEPQLILEELRYWNSNFRLLSLSPGEAEQALERGLALYPDARRPAEDYLLAQLASRYDIENVLSPALRPDGNLGGVKFLQPQVLLKR